MTEKIEYETIVVDEADGKKTVMRVPKFPASYDQMARIAFLARGPYKCTCNPHTTKSICTKCGGLK